jgi:hypothetical protein
METTEMTKINLPGSYNIDTTIDSSDPSADREKGKGQLLDFHGCLSRKSYCRDEIAMRRDSRCSPQTKAIIYARDCKATKVSSEFDIKLIVLAATLIWLYIGKGIIAANDTSLSRMRRIYTLFQTNAGSYPYVILMRLILMRVF